MRVTQGMQYSTYVNDIMRRQEAVYENHKRLSTGKNVNAPSDDPVKAGSIIRSRGLLSEIGQYEKTAEYGLSYLNAVEKTFDGSKEILTKLREIALLESSATADINTRTASHKVALQLFNELLRLGNASFDGNYILSGYKTDTPAFDSTGAFQGDSNKSSIKIGPSATMTIGVNGGEVFKGTAGGMDIFQAVQDFLTALSTNDSTGIANAIGTLETSFDQISYAQADVGGMVTRLNMAKESLSRTSYDLRIAISGLEDADITKVISDIRLGQMALEASFSAAGKIFEVNIFDYL